jgi:hypothetical protein
MAQKTGQVLVRTLRDPRRAESPVISGKKEGYVRSCELKTGGVSGERVIPVDA